MKKIYLNYVCLLSGVILFIASLEMSIDGVPGLIMILSSVFLMMLGFMIGNNPFKVILEFLKNLLD